MAIKFVTLSHAYVSGSSSSPTAQQVVSNDDQPELFERIEATKLQEAVSNASAMGQLQVRQNVVTDSVCIFLSM